MRFRSPALAAPLLALTALAPSPATAAGGAPFTCEGSVLRGQVLTTRALEPLVANRGAACATRIVGIPNLTAPLGLLGADVLAVSTRSVGDPARRDRQQAVAAASVTDLAVGSLGSLGLPLPLDQIPLPPGLMTIDVPLGGVALPALPGGLLGGVVPTLPSSIRVDIAAAVRELVKLPTTPVLRLKAATSIAGASCVGGKPVTAGRRNVAGLSVLGTAIDVDTLGDRSIVDTQTIDLSQLDLSKVVIPTGNGLTSGLISTLLPQLNTAIAAALAPLPDVALPIDLLRVQVTPGSRTTSADGLTQTALGLKVSALGQSVLDVVLAEAKVGTAGVDCTPPAPVAGGPTTTAQATLSCTKRRLVLTDVVRRGSRVTITGAADKRFVGRFVTVKFEADGLTAGRALVAPDGTFATTAALPSRKLRASNRARYQAVLGREKSLNLKLERRMDVDRLSAAGGKVTVVGRVTRPLGTPVQTITLTRRVSCRRSVVVARFKPKANGTFRVVVAAPKGTVSTVYRLGTRVRKTAANPKLFPTFTLPQGVSLTS